MRLHRPVLDLACLLLAALLSFSVTAQNRGQSSKGKDKQEEKREECVTVNCKQSVGLGSRECLMTVESKGVRYKSETMKQGKLIPWEVIKDWSWIGYADSLGFHWDNETDKSAEKKQYFSFRIENKQDQSHLVECFRKYAPSKEKK